MMSPERKGAAVAVAVVVVKFLDRIRIRIRGCPRRRIGGWPGGGGGDLLIPWCLVAFPCSTVYDKFDSGVVDITKHLPR